MKHRLLRNTILFIMVFLLVAIGGYQGMNSYYKDVFPAHTWINGVYCTGKTVAEVNEELLQDVKAPVVTITDKDGNQAQIDLADAGYEEDYEVALTRFAEELGSLSLFEKLTVKHSIYLAPAISWDSHAVWELFYAIPEIASELDREVKTDIIYEDGEYFWLDDSKNRLMGELAYGYICDCIVEKKYDINLVEGECYMDYPSGSYGNTPEEMYDTWAKLDDFMDCGIVYDMGAEQITVDRKTAAGFITLDENGDFLLDENGELVPDEEAMISFIDEIVEAYDTVGTELAYEATRGETVMVPYKKYGTKLDRDAEVEYFLNAFKEDVSEVHVPKYEKEGYVRGLDDIGDTYIEIDMTEQKMYAYVDGFCEVETDIVTGSMNKGWDTPVGVNYVYAKQKNRILRGADYESFVNYWMPVNGGIGIHDATWRSKFGGEIYKKNGSHGCINTPKADMKKIYELYEVGTPVIMFY